MSHISSLEDYLLNDKEFPVQRYILELESKLQVTDEQKTSNKTLKILSMLKQYVLISTSIINEAKSMGSALSLAAHPKKYLGEELKTQGNLLHDLHVSFESNFLPELMSFIRREVLKRAKEISSGRKKNSQFNHCHKAEHLILAVRGDVSAQYLQSIVERGINRVEFENELVECERILSLIQ
ncbi:comB [Acrasis kona]|uniref:ComB n=1 Tax=Acrasis kona TaxID=1008807 RepID=A0AAW2YMB0_9EUKA